MEILERVREINAGEGLSEEQIAAARMRLMNGVGAGAARRPAARRPLLIAGGLAAGMAAVITVGVIVARPTPVQPGVEAAPSPTSVPRPEGTVMPRPISVASALRDAAKAAGANAAPTLREGQFLRIETTVDDLVLYGATNPETLYDASRSEATAAWTARTSWILYVPADRSEDWVREFPSGAEVTAVFGDSADTHAQDWLANIDQSASSFIERTPGGLGEPSAGELSVASDAYYAAFPREPEALLDRIQEENGATDGSEWSAGTVTEVLIQELQRNTAPADLRAAMFEALRLLPNSRISGIDGSLVTVSFASNAGRWISQAITIDISTGTVVGTSITRTAGSGIVPDAIADDTTTVTTSIVDSAP